MIRLLGILIILLGTSFVSRDTILQNIKKHMIKEGVHWQNLTKCFKIFLYIYFLGKINRNTYTDLLSGSANEIGSGDINTTILGLILTLIGSLVQFFN